MGCGKSTVGRQVAGELGFEFVDADTLIVERAGVLNLGIEGIMVAGAFAGWIAVWGGLPLWGGVAVAMLTGMDVANASMYDGASACAEAVLMAHRVTKRKKAILCGGLHPHYRDATETVPQFIDFEVDAQPANPDAIEYLAALIDPQTACVVVQTPDLFGRLHDLRALADAAHDKGALLVAVVTEGVSLAPSPRREKWVPISWWAKGNPWAMP